MRTLHTCTFILFHTIHRSLHTSQQQLHWIEEFYAVNVYCKKFSFLLENFSFFNIAFTTQSSLPFPTQFYGFNQMQIMFSAPPENNSFLGACSMEDGVHVVRRMGCDTKKKIRSEKIETKPRRDSFQKRFVKNINRTINAPHNES